MTTHDPNHKGNVAEMAIAAAATKLGIDVSKPLVEHARYDLIFDVRGHLLRVQCKWAPIRKEVIQVNLISSRCSSAGEQIRTAYSPEEIDAIGVYCEELDRCYLVPIGPVAGMRSLSLRLTKPRNGQRASLNWASEYELEGAVAQLEVAPAWHAGGRGFESHQLHSPDSDGVELVGAHEFRNHFGWYMERALAGELFVVTKRGTPSLRLVPIQSRLPLDGRSSGRAFAPQTHSPPDNHSSSFHPTSVEPGEQSNTED
jgi:prevent-host-death family protein